jgi:6-phosphogluconate dehydrogenase
MELGMIGLGRMGTNMVRRLLRAGHQCVVYDLHPEAAEALVKGGAVGATSLEDFTHKLKKPRAAALKPKGIHDVDVGTSGGVWGQERGYCLMIGGDEAVVQRLDPVFAAPKGGT